MTSRVPGSSVTPFTSIRPPAAGGRGRYFLQVHYGRRDLAQRVRTTAQVNHVAPEALARARGERQRTILGLHDPAFYDG